MNTTPEEPPPNVVPPPPQDKVGGLIDAVKAKLKALTGATPPPVTPAPGATPTPVAPVAPVNTQPESFRNSLLGKAEATILGIPGELRRPESAGTMTKVPTLSTFKKQPIEPTVETLTPDLGRKETKNKPKGTSLLDALTPKNAGAPPAATTKPINMNDPVVKQIAAAISAMSPAERSAELAKLTAIINAGGQLKELEKVAYTLMSQAK